MTNFEIPRTRTELARLLGVHRATLLNYERRGLLPEPIRVNCRRVEFTAEMQMIATDLVAGSRS